MGPSNERIDVNASTAVRSARGFYFGTLRWIHGDRLLVEVDADIDEDEIVELRITLAPSPGTALMRVKMQRNLVTAQGETPRFIFAVDEVSPGEQNLLEKWLENAGGKGTFSSFDAVSTSAPLSRGMGGASRAEVRNTLERMNRTSGAPERSDNFGISSDKGGQSPRAAMRDALRKAIAAPPVDLPRVAERSIAPVEPRPERSVLPAEPPRSVPPVSAATTHARADVHLSVPRAIQASLTPSRPPSTVRLGEMAPMSNAPRSVGPPARLPPQPPTAPASIVPSRERAGLAPIPVRPRSIPPAEVDIAAPSRRPGSTERPPTFEPVTADPNYATTSTRSAVWLEVRWTAPAVFANDADALLKNPVLTLPNLGERLPDAAPLRLMLRHDEILLDCAGDVEEYGPFGASYHVRLEPLHRYALEVWLKGYRKK